MNPHNMTLFDEIKMKLTDLEIIAEKMEPSRKEQFLDMIDSFEAAIKSLLDETPEEMKEADRQHAEDKSHIRDSII